MVTPSANDATKSYRWVLEANIVPFSTRLTTNCAVIVCIDAIVEFSVREFINCAFIVLTSVSVIGSVLLTLYVDNWVLKSAIFEFSVREFKNCAVIVFTSAKVIGSVRVCRKAES